jgi:hypothetical protein
MMQRNMIVNAIEHNASVPDDTILLISDCDEIPRPEAIAALRERGLNDGEVVIFRQTLYYYNLNTSGGDVWQGTRAARWADVKALSPHVIRYGLANGDGHYPRHLVAHTAGWHLSYFGGPEQVQAKMRAFLHQELVNADTLGNAARRIAAGADLYGRPRGHGHDFVRAVTADVPPPVLADPDRWRHLYHPELAP